MTGYAVFPRAPECPERRGFMPRFFVQASSIHDGVVTITGGDAVHISRSLRMRAGERIVVCDMQKNEYDCVLEDFTADTVKARVAAVRKSDTEPPYRIRLFQALPKSEKMDIIIQKSVECGVSEIIPFESERCVTRELASPDRSGKKLERRRRIALEAAKQCGRGIIPEVTETISFRAMFERASQSTLKLFFYEGDGTVSLRELLTTEFSASDSQDDCGTIARGRRDHEAASDVTGGGQVRKAQEAAPDVASGGQVRENHVTASDVSRDREDFGGGRRGSFGRLPEDGDISIVIGAEGGFSQDEVALARDAGFYVCGLGKRILRCETAPLFALSCLDFWFEV